MPNLAENELFAYIAQYEMEHSTFDTLLATPLQHSTNQYISYNSSDADTTTKADTIPGQTTRHEHLSRLLKIQNEKTHNVANLSNTSIELGDKPPNHKFAVYSNPEQNKQAFQPELSNITQDTTIILGDNCYETSLLDIIDAIDDMYL